MDSIPHWTWPERVGQITPIHVFTSGDEAELGLAIVIIRAKPGARGPIKVIARSSGLTLAETIIQAK